MNDFTKEELQEIKRCIKYMIDGGITPYSSLTLEINKKLKSIIEKYCEHSMIYNQHHQRHCEKCGVNDE